MQRFKTLPDRMRPLTEAHAAGETDTATFLEACTRLVAATVDCSRCGVWQFVEADGGQRVLRALAMYDAEADAMEAVPDCHDIGAYFLALAHMGYVNACDVASHYATVGPFAERLQARRIRSLLAASLAVNGKVYGALTCSETDREVEWSQAQASGLRRAAARIVVPLFAGPGSATRPAFPGSFPQV